MKKQILGLMAGLAIAMPTMAIAESADEWQARAQLGAHAPEVQDWDAIEAAAREEGQVIIYSTSSRIFSLVDEFKERYGVEIIGHDIASAEQLEKFRREHEAGIYAVDIIYGNESPTLLAEFAPEGLVWNFVPDSARAFLSEEEMEPFLVQRWSSRIFFYNTEAHPDGTPATNLWDFTKPEWKGRLLMNDIDSGLHALVMQTILQHGDEMEAAYEAAFGEPITYSEKVIAAAQAVPGIGEPNAAIEWLYRIIHNDLGFVSSTNQMFSNVASVGQANPPMGTGPFSKLRDVELGVYEAAAAYGLEPTFGVAYPTVLVIADRAPNPNAAKLLIRHMIGEGFEPWNVLGDYAARSDVEAAQTEKYGIPPISEAGMWLMDPVHVYDTKFSYLQLVLSLQ